MRVRTLPLLLGAGILLLCATLGFVITLGTALLWGYLARDARAVVADQTIYYADSPIGPQAAQSPLASVFTNEVLYWTPLIQAWAAVYQVDPNLIATLIQIESCGDPSVASPAGAQGLFQVMPFHFDPGEDMLDVQTNARRGLSYLLTGLRLANGHAGLALAGYNGGHGIIDDGWAAWSAETRRYYYWGARIYAEAKSGLPASPTLAEWLSAGGSRLCERARQTQARLEQENKAQVMVAQAP